MIELGEVIEHNIEVEAENSSKNIDDASDSPLFKQKVNKITPRIKHCKTCGTECTTFSIDDECLTCSLKRLRKLETKLAELKQIKNEHEFCCIDGHSEIYKNKLHPEWEGKIVINGIELYPVYPLCNECLDVITAYLVMFLEERGILRKGSDNNKNRFGDPYSIPLKISEKQEALSRLEEFIRSTATIYTKDPGSPTNILYEFIKSRRKMILENDKKGILEWQKEREIVLPKNQLELLKLAEKYYPCLQNGTDELKQKYRQKEISWLRRQPIPEPVLLKIAKIVEQGVKMLHLQLDQEEVEQQKWSKQSLTIWLRKEKKVDDLDVQNMWKWIMEQTEIALGPFADSVVEILDQAMEKVTLSNLTSESTINE